MTTFIKKYMESCTKCQQMKVNTHLTTPPLTLIKSEGGCPFSLITMDFITDLLESNGYDSLMVVVDHGSTKGVIFIPCNKMINALGAAMLLLDHVYKRFGLPDKIISNRDPCFASQLFQELGRLLRIRLAMSMAYHPQTNGQTEHVNQEVEIYLRMFCSNNPNTWRMLLPTAEFTINQRTHSTQKASPFYLMMGYEPKVIPTPFPTTNVPTAQEQITILQRARDEALAAHELAHQTMAERITRGFTPFKLGQKVWLDTKNLRMDHPTWKLAPKREGFLPSQRELVISLTNYSFQHNGEFTPSSMPPSSPPTRKMTSTE